MIQRSRSAEEWLALGRQQIEMGVYQAALESFDRAIALNPNLAEAWDGKGTAFRKLYRFEEAIAASEKAIKIRMNALVNDAEFWLNQGNQLYMAGDFEGAIASYDRALQYKPDFHEAWYNRGIFLRSLERFEDAIASYDRALQYKPDFHEAWLNRGFALNTLGRFEEAITSYDRALQYEPDFHEAWLNRGFVLNTLGRFEEAIASYDRALQSKLDFWKAWFNRGIALENLGRFEDAITNYDRAVQYKPDYYEAWSNRSVALNNLGRFEEAITSYDRALRYKPDDHEAWYNRGTILSNLERSEEAIASYDRALQYKPDFHEAWYNRGIALGKIKRPEEAIASFDQALQYRPDKYEAWLNRGSAIDDVGRFEDAIASYDRALQYKPDLHEARLNRGVALSNLGRFEEAIASYDQALQSKPDFSEAWYGRGVLLSELGRFEDAIASCDRALQSKPDFSEAWYSRGISLGNLGRFEDAITSYDRAVQYKPNFHEAWYNRGTALINLERFEDAITSYDRGLQYKLDDQHAWFNRGISLENLGRFEEAITNYDRAVQYKPDYYEAWNSRGIALGNLGRFEEAITNYDQGLTHVLQTIQPKGWGRLHQGKGITYYRKGELENNLQSAKILYRQARSSYYTALQTLEDFPESYLELIQDLIKVSFALDDSDAANQWQIKGLEVFRQLLNAQPTSPQKQRLEAKFSGFSRIAVEVLVQNQQFTTALESAERYKNRCLTWILDEWKEQITSPSYAAMQQLLSDSTAIAYWHFSDDALTTFILLPNSDAPILLDLDWKTQCDRAQNLKNWFKTWNTNYNDYRNKEENQSDHPWRKELANQLTKLKTILGVNAIAQTLSQAKVQNLILIPHRDLHRVPIHAFFEPFNATYLPSAQIGLALKRKPSPGQWQQATLLSVEDPESDRAQLPYAQLESALICQQFPNHKRLDERSATQIAVTQALESRYQIFHFTGHGSYSSRKPEHSAISLTQDEQLTAQAIRHLDLSSYQLVCLSACETALTGQQTIDTEYVGLTSAFLQANATTVVSTLWNVHEISNTWLILKFYELLQANLPPANALKTAQSWLRTLTYTHLSEWLQHWLSILPANHAYRQDIQDEMLLIQNALTDSKLGRQDLPYADPYHWAAFTFTGKVDPI